MRAYDSETGQPDPLRVKVFDGEQKLSTDDRLGYLIEFVAQLDIRLKALENHVTALVTRSVDQGLGH